MPSQALKSREHCVYALSYHLVLVTKYRRRCLSGTMLDQARDIAARLCARWECELREANGEADHLHLLIETIPAVHPIRLVNTLKTVLSRLLRRDHAAHLARFYPRHPVLWSPSYCLITCGGAPLETIRQYIQNQAAAD